MIDEFKKPLNISGNKLTKLIFNNDMFYYFFSGFLIFVPKADVIELKMSVEEGLKFIISCGIVEPEKLGAKIKSKSKKKLFKKSAQKR